MKGDTLQIDPPFPTYPKNGGGGPSPHVQPEKIGGWGTLLRITNHELPTANRGGAKGDTPLPTVRLAFLRIILFNCEPFFSLNCFFV